MTFRELDISEPILKALSKENMKQLLLFKNKQCQSYWKLMI